MDNTLLTHLIAGVKNGSIVPYLGPGVLADVTSVTNGQHMPVSSDDMIIAMNGGRPMAPKLMYEFSRAAMNVELKRGRNAVTRFLNQTYGDTQWTRACFHDWLKSVAPAYVIDINRDTQLIDSYADRPHLLILGCSRIGGTAYRFKLYAYDGTQYKAIEPETAPAHLPILFKPMGAPKPEASYIASDADYVDYITELMGGFGIPHFVKTMRKEKQYLLLGMRLNRDTERMVLSDIIYGATKPAGWALIEQPTVKERRFLERQNIELIEGSLSDFLASAGVSQASPLTA